MMRNKQYVLFEPGGRQVRGFSYGKLVEVRYLDVIPAGVESPDREEFIALVRAQELSDEDLREYRVGYVDDNGVGDYCSWQEFLDMTTEFS
jgi:hypothetical protein